MQELKGIWRKLRAKKIKSSHIYRIYCLKQLEVSKEKVSAVQSNQEEVVQMQNDLLLSSNSKKLPCQDCFDFDSDVVNKRIDAPPGGSKKEVKENTLAEKINKPKESYAQEFKVSIGAADVARGTRSKGWVRKTPSGSQSNAAASERKLSDSTNTTTNNNDTSIKPAKTNASSNRQDDFDCFAHLWKLALKKDCSHATSRKVSYQPEVLSVSDSDSVSDSLSVIDSVSDEPPTFLDWIHTGKIDLDQFVPVAAVTIQSLPLCLLLQHNIDFGTSNHLQ